MHRLEISEKVTSLCTNRNKTCSKIRDFENVWDDISGAIDFDDGFFDGELVS